MNKSNPHPSVHDYGILSCEDIGFWENTIQRVVSDFGELVLLELGVANGGTTIGTKRLCDRMGWPMKWVGLDMACGRPAFDLGNWGVFIEGNFHDSEIHEGVKGEFNLLFVDGDHCFDCCTKDFVLYSPKVRKGGYVCFHDTCSHRDWQNNFEQCRPDRYIETRRALREMNLDPCTREDYEYIGQQDAGRTQGMMLFKKLVD